MTVTDLAVNVPAPVTTGVFTTLVVRAPVKEFIEVRDTSGRRERRPVIETTLEIGPVRRRIQITLTDRGDMRCPMLVGRTALGAGVVVDPSARYLLGAGRAGVKIDRGGPAAAADLGPTTARLDRVGTLPASRSKDSE